MSALCRDVCLAAEDAVELRELLEFLVERIDYQTRLAPGSMTGFVSEFPGYDVWDLRADLGRFAFLLGGTNPELVFGPEEEEDQ